MKIVPIPSPNTPVTRDWQTVRYSEWAYVMTAADFPEGYSVRHSAYPGRPGYATGENKLGITVTLPLNVLLCKGCDGEIDHGTCPSCELVFLDDHVVTLGDERGQVWL